MRRWIGPVVALTAVAAACGSQRIEVSEQDKAGAELFNQRCSGCHTLRAVGTQGSSTNVRTREYKDGPNFDARKVTRNCALFAIRNGGFSSGPMPQNIVVGADAEAIADFLARYSGGDRPSSSGPQQDAPDCPAP
jgi:mono/diheme cytochrome c family protein